MLNIFIDMDSRIHVYIGRMFIRLIGWLYTWSIVYMYTWSGVYKHPQVRAIGAPILCEVVIALHKHTLIIHKHTLIQATYIFFKNILTVSLKFDIINMYKRQIFSSSMIWGALFMRKGGRINANTSRD